MKVWQTFILTSHMFMAVFLGTLKDPQAILGIMALLHFGAAMFIGGISRGQL